MPPNRDTRWVHCGSPFQGEEALDLAPEGVALGYNGGGLSGCIADAPDDPFAFGLCSRVRLWNKTFMNKAAGLARYIDHTVLKAQATAADIDKLCREALAHNFYSVCVNGCRLVQARFLLEDSPIKIATVVGFPLGATDPDVKRYETEVAVDLGADEIDVVMNVGKLKDGDDKFVLRELRDVVESADERPVKVILETSLLTHDEKLRACAVAVDAGAHFVKTSTGFFASGATTSDIKLMREAVGPTFGIKASGGIKDAATAWAMIGAGATRLGTSASVALVQDASEDE